MLRIKHIPQRRCFACGTHAAKGELIRLVRTVTGSVEVDPTGKASGRGCYLCRQAQCWAEGMKKSRIDYVLRCTVTQQDKERLLNFISRELGIKS